jgi:hypothetical protein
MYYIYMINRKQCIIFFPVATRCIRTPPLSSSRIFRRGPRTRVWLRPKVSLLAGLARLRSRIRSKTAVASFCPAKIFPPHAARAELLPSPRLCSRHPSHGTRGAHRFTGVHPSFRSRNSTRKSTKPWPRRSAPRRSRRWLDTDGAVRFVLHCGSTAAALDG